jgi:hypothetical protein
MLNALGMRFGEPLNKDAPSMKTVTRRAPGRYTGTFTNQDVSINKVYHGLENAGYGWYRGFQTHKKP